MDMLKHLLERKFDPSRYLHYHIDHDEELFYVYLTNEYGKFTGFQKYNPNVTAKRMNHPTEARYFSYSRRGENAFWGLETLKNSGTIFLVESVFKASALHLAGFQAIASLNASPNPQLIDWLKNPYLNRQVVAIGDDDKAGKNLVERYGFVGFTLPKDLDDYETEELRELVTERWLETWR